MLKSSSASFSKEHICALFDRFGDLPLLALGVSGGPDSVALMNLVAAWCDDRSNDGLPCPRVHILTVDHGLRPEAAKEAQAVAAWSAALGFQHHCLVWSGEKPSSNLQAQARQARYRLMAQKLKQLGGNTLFIAHTQDDQAETLLMRLARGSGVDGLCAMQTLSTYKDIEIARPLLAIQKADLVAYLQQRQQPFFEDPSNNDDRFDRVRMRRLMAEFAELGGTTTRLAQTASQMQRVALALASQTEALFAETTYVFEGLGFALIDLNAFISADEEIRLRLLRSLIEWIRPRTYPPRLSALTGLDDYLGRAASTDQVLRRVLGGVVFDANQTKCLVYAEAGRHGFPVMEANWGDTLLWDDRLKLILPDGSRDGSLTAGESVIVTGFQFDGAKDTWLCDVKRQWPILSTLSDESLSRAIHSLPMVKSAKDVRSFPIQLVKASRPFAKAEFFETIACRKADPH